jgi:hypothetical protein
MPAVVVSVVGASEYTIGVVRDDQRPIFFVRIALAATVLFWP